MGEIGEVYGAWSATADAGRPSCSTRTRSASPSVSHWGTTRRGSRASHGGIMPSPEHVTVDVGDITLAQFHGGELALGDIPGVQVVVLLRHRH